MYIPVVNHPGLVLLMPIQNLELHNSTGVDAHFQPIIYSLDDLIIYRKIVPLLSMN